MDAVTPGVAVRAAGVACLSLMVLAGCAGTSVPTASTAAGRSAERGRVAVDAIPRYVDRTWGFRIEVPSGWEVRHGFSGSYLASDTWRTYASPGNRGVAILALILPDSNRITDAEIRIGASRDRGAVRGCTRPPSTLRPGSLDRERVGGTTFTTFDAGDAAMSHWLEVRAYRVVHDGACYAIDLLVYGTNPEVYDPPATPPFARTDAFASMHAVLQTFRFTH